jgi:hypothetical protein
VWDLLAAASEEAGETNPDLAARHFLAFVMQAHGLPETLEYIDTFSLVAKQVSR